MGESLPWEAGLTARPAREPTPPLSNSFIPMRRLATNLVTYITEMIGGNPGFAAIMVCAVWVEPCAASPPWQLQLKS